MLPARDEVEPARLADRDEAGFELALELPALRRHPGFGFGRNLPETRLEHDVDHALGRGIAILQRNLFGEDLDLGDRLSSEERRVVHKCVSTVKYRWVPY